jgi:cytochrome c553
MCHDGGVGMKLDKFPVSEIKKDLLDFKTGKKYHSMMAFVKNMSDKEIEEAAQKYGKKD